MGALGLYFLSRAFMTITARQFLELVRRSTLLTDAELKRGLEACKEAHDGSIPTSADTIADFLVSENLITTWHRDKLLNRKYKGFFLGKYKLLGHIGAGGMSSVYLAEHTLMRRLRAIKVLPRNRVDDSSYLERFHREAQATAVLDHPNIVRAYDVDNQGQTHYLVMEYVPGRDLMTIVKEDGPLDYLLAAKYIYQSALGLQHAHDAAMVHRDVKPANLLVDESDSIKILDMGLALMDEDQSELAGLTDKHNEKVLGTADYLAPEQALNSHNIDGRADIYGLGCTLYYVLTGHPPFPEGTLAQRIAQHQSKLPPDIRMDRPDLPEALGSICFKMMQKNPDHRYQTAQLAAQDLEAWLVSQGVELTPAKSDVVHLPQRADANQSTESVALAMHAAVAVANQGAIASGQSSLQSIGDLSAVVGNSQVVSDSIVGFGSSRISLGDEIDGQAFQSTSRSLLDTRTSSITTTDAAIWKTVALILGILLLFATIVVAIQMLTADVEDAIETHDDPISSRYGDYKRLDSEVVDVNNQVSETGGHKVTRDSKSIRRKMRV